MKSGIVIILSASLFIMGLLDYACLSLRSSERLEEVGGEVSGEALLSVNESVVSPPLGHAIRIDSIDANVVPRTGPLGLTVAASLEDPHRLPAAIDLLVYDRNDELLANAGRMLDDGAHGDGLAGDGRYGLSLEMDSDVTVGLRLRAALSYADGTSPELSKGIPITITRG